MLVEKIVRFFEDTLDDIGYSIKRSMAYVLGKSGGQIAGLQMGLLAGPLLAVIAGFDPTSAGTAGATIGNILAIGAVATVSGSLMQVDFKHQRKQLLERYREEASAPPSPRKGKR